MEAGEVQAATEEESGGIQERHKQEAPLYDRWGAPETSCRMGKTEGCREKGGGDTEIGLYLRFLPPLPSPGIHA